MCRRPKRRKNVHVSAQVSARAFVAAVRWARRVCGAWRVATAVSPAVEVEVEVEVLETSARARWLYWWARRRVSWECARVAVKMAVLRRLSIPAVVVRRRARWRRVARADLRRDGRVGADIFGGGSVWSRMGWVGGVGCACGLSHAWVGVFPYRGIGVSISTDPELELSPVN